MRKPMFALFFTDETHDMTIGALFRSWIGATIPPMATIAAPVKVSAVQRPRIQAPALAYAPVRMVLLDVFRGLTMILLISHAFVLIEALKDKTGFIASQFDHAAWVGCTLWDLIQPAFTFIVGAAM